MPNKPRLDPGLIESAPLLPSTEPGGNAESLYLELVGSLSSELESAQAELIQIKAKKTVDDVRAGMLEGYSNRVFWFVVWYCIAVGVLLVASGFKGKTAFELSDTILAIIAGSTAVAVIGLIGMVITGLFGGKQALQVKAKSSKKKKLSTG